MSSQKLTIKQERFVESYARCLNASQAAREAGYSPRTAPFIGAENLKKPQIVAALQTRGLNNSLIASREELQEFWSQVTKSDEHDLVHRLKASELLGKSLGAFIDRQKVEASVVATAVPAIELTEERRRALVDVLSGAAAIEEG